jgi:two-component system response regulator AtoC
MLEFDDLIALAAQTESPVLLLGEPGTGKGRVAQSIHSRGPRATQPLHVVDCPRLHETTAERALFPNQRRGAEALTHQGCLFERAEGATVFLRDVSELPYRAQAMLLRTLETQCARRSERANELPAGVRLLTATSRNLEALVRAGRFREDLFYRLSALTLWVPPLRARRGEIASLAQDLLNELARTLPEPPPTLSAATTAKLAAHDWPGNVPQLRTVLERAMRVCADRIVEPWDLRLDLAETPTAIEQALRRAPDTPHRSDQSTFREHVRAFEAALIRAALTECRGNQRAAARRLRIPLRTLANKIKAYELRPPALAGTDAPPHPS